VKSTKNVPRWLILTTSLFLVSSLSGCASFDLFGKREKPIEITTKPVERTNLDIPLPDPIKTKPIEWMVVTPENADAVFKKLEEKGQDVVLFAITSDGYQQLAMTIGDLRNLINTQRAIIIKYKEYYEPKKDDSKK
jgi:hypothetical protein